MSMFGEDKASNDYITRDVVNPKGIVHVYRDFWWWCVDGDPTKAIFYRRGQRGPGSPQCNSSQMIAQGVGAVLRYPAEAKLVQIQIAFAPWEDCLREAKEDHAASQITMQVHPCADCAQKDVEIAALRTALRETRGALVDVVDDSCSLICPSTGRAGVPIPHSDRCLNARAVLTRDAGLVKEGE